MQWQKMMNNLIHIYGLDGFSTSENDRMILILRLSFPKFRISGKFNWINFL